jgi:hypothetical protein
MPKLTTTPEIGAFLASQTKTEARSKIGFDASPISVANTVARKDLNSYTDGEPQPGATQVIQSDLPGIVWTLISSDVTNDDSWIGQPFTLEPNGQIVINLEIADVKGTLPDVGILGRIGNKLTIGDGITEGGVKVDKGAPFLPTLLIKSDASTEAYMYDEIPNNQFSGDDYPGLRIGDSVTSIGSYAFAYWSTNNAPLVIPDNVTSIDDSAFRIWSANNAPLVIPDSVTSIGISAFGSWGANNQPLVIGDSVTSIGNYAFSSWSSNNAPLVIGDSVTSIGDGTFGGWYANNQPLVIPDSVTSIGNYAFYFWGSNNQPLVIPDSVTSIGNRAFGNWFSNIQPIHIACSFSAFTGSMGFNSKGSTPAIYVLPDKGWTLGTQNFQGISNVNIQLWTSYPDLMP